ncbi:hypothetical protein MEN41_10340 [Dolichospermum sp. ST_con]|nr:hypothetical protein [Dolichospermum sp. ST_con]MDD1418111.1 hypothetical protein [Dolichospermum sp. ST_sed1]MDD1427065.1 hypothetical protein [Dolichospermum sp. ST_sed9]MDD1430563.1 hypothetical protein [Dolichospermum sp. ST_sed6]MDD1437845.1 hypothetical protein [Dolichospermum sp. ST_sed10]MDD1439402.1 hypothetical protein [Dolichospermum sp. ST_sed3]MDD1445429.1 hypothetical protein [Dolichospermum sp. ST_sed8]MDD1455064.1 hypothetical protein [Dolichospermum sp. ST_sed7]MDD145882
MNTPANSFNSQDNNKQHNLNKKLRVFADFNNADEEDRLRLNCIGTIEDLARQKIELQDSQTLTFYSEDLEVEGIVKHSPEENIWVAVIDWDNIRQVEYLPKLMEKLRADNPSRRSKTRRTVIVEKPKKMQNPTVEAAKGLKALKEIFKEGIITEEEYQSKRQSLVDKL